MTVCSRFVRSWWGVLLIVGLAACTASTSTPTPPRDPAPGTNITAATPAISIITVTNAPTANAGSETPAPLASETPALSATAVLTGTPAALGSDKAEFVSDVTVPDGSEITAGATFTKTWRLKNVGTTAWGPGYELVFVRGDQMGGPPSTALPANVAPGQTVDLSVELTAASDVGLRTGFWLLRNPAGALFGVGPNGNEAIYVQIRVSAAPSVI